MEIRDLLLGILFWGIFDCRCVVIKDNSILLISSHTTENKWVLPKGGWELDENEYEAAKRETFEEAGVQSILILL